MNVRSSTPAKKPDNKIKMIIIGEATVGKTSMVHRFEGKSFDETPKQTSGIDSVSRDIELDGVPIKVWVWDTGGQERFRTITSSYYRGAHGILLVYDITQKSSFEKVPIWLHEVDRFACENVHKFLVGNKSDLEEQRQVTTEEAEKYGRSLGLSLIETSAKTGKNVDEAFLKLARKIRDGKQESQERIEEPASSQTDSPSKDGKKTFKKERREKE